MSRHHSPHRGKREIGLQWLILVRSRDGSSQAARGPGWLSLTTEGSLLRATPPPGGSLAPCSLPSGHPLFKTSVGRNGGSSLLDFSGRLVSLGRSYLLRTVCVCVLR